MEYDIKVLLIVVKWEVFINNRWNCVFNLILMLIILFFSFHEMNFFLYFLRDYLNYYLVFLFIYLY
jgi:hypothetical protein